MISVFVVGPPGVGKTTLVRELLGKDPYLIQKPKWTVGERAFAAGHYVGGTFDGADTVPYNGVEVALQYWKLHLLPGRKDELSKSFFDGDRFSHEKALGIVRESSKRVVCVHLTADAETLKARRASRGSNQNESWMRGRETKAARFADLFPAEDRLDLPSDRKAVEQFRLLFP